MTEAAGQEQTGNAIAVQIDRLRRGFGALVIVDVSAVRADASLPAPANRALLLEDLGARRPDPALLVRDILEDETSRARRKQASFFIAGEGTASNEFEALRDLHEGLILAEYALAARPNDPCCQESMENSRLLRERLHFVGQEELLAGTQAMAGRWLKHARESDAERLLVLVEPNRSSSLIYDAFKSHIELADPEAARRLMPLLVKEIATRELASTEAQTLLAQDGVTVLDDWTITGHRMNIVLSLLSMHTDLNKVRLDFVCAPQRTLQDGMDIMGTIVPVQAAYAFDDALVHKGGGIAVTGAHAAPTWGFAQTVRGIYECVRSIVGPNVSIPDPLLLHPRRTYRKSAKTN